MSGEETELPLDQEHYSYILNEVPASTIQNFLMDHQYQQQLHAPPLHHHGNSQSQQQESYMHPPPPPPYSPGPMSTGRPGPVSVSPVSSNSNMSHSPYHMLVGSDMQMQPTDDGICWSGSYPELPSSITPAPIRLPTIPSTQEYPGDSSFEISFGPTTERAAKAATWTYSEKCKKLYVNYACYCPVKFKTVKTPPGGAVIRAMAVFKGSNNLHDIVRRCPNHTESSSANDDHPAPPNHLIRSNNSRAIYENCPDTGRHSVIVPYNGPEVGTEYVTELYAFMCFSSCAAGPGRRPIMVIFTLEKDGRTLGRQVVEVRICACPGRDRKADEGRLLCNGHANGINGKKNKRARTGPKAKEETKRKSQKTDTEETDEEYSITTRNKDVFDILMHMKEKLEEKFDPYYEGCPSPSSSESEEVTPALNPTLIRPPSGPHIGTQRTGLLAKEEAC